MKTEVICNVLRILACCIVFAYYLFIPFKTRFRYGYLKTAVLTFLLVIITISVVVLFLTKGMPWTDYSSFGILLWIISAMLLFHMAIKGSFFEIFFIVLVILNLYVDIAAIVKMLLSMFDIGLGQQMARALLTVGVLILYIPLLYFLMIKLYSQVIEFSVKFSFWKFLWVVPALAYLIFFVKIVNDYWIEPAQVGASDVVFIILWSFTSYVLFCVTLQMLIQTYQGMSAKTEAHLIASQMKVQKGQYERLLDNMEKTARLRHDWRHHMLCINSYAENNDMEGLLVYLKELLPEYSTVREMPVCANYIVNAILTNHAATAKAQGVDMKIATNIEKGISISDTDLCIIFGNLVENAVEAALSREDDDKRVEIRADMQGKQLVLLIRNTYSGTVLSKKGVYYSTKHEGAGIGIMSVRKVVEKNKGIMKIGYDEKYFSVNVLLNLK